jgi:signal transduction histidine kinase
LISNAIKYTPANGAIMISLSYQDGEIKGRVSDTGIGIPADDQEKIFSEFFRASNAREEGIPGTGLGLAIVNKIIEGWDGEISLKSTIAGGTTIDFRFPVEEISLVG